MDTQQGHLPPAFTPARESAEIGADLTRAIERVLKSGVYLLGPELEALEAELCEIAGHTHAVGVGSGTDALVITLRALGIGPGDEVIVPAITAIPTAAAVVLAGATPVLADVDPATACLTAESVASAYTSRTSAAIVVHLYGYPAPMDSLAAVASDRQIALIEDMAQAFGARDGTGSMVGGAGIAGCASFYPTKVLAAVGDAGAILTDDAELAAKARLLRSHGHQGEYRHSVIAGNSRLDEIQSAVLRTKLPHLEGWLARRRNVANMFRRALGALPEGIVRFQAESAGHAYQVLAARIEDRDSVRADLAGSGLELLVHYPLTLAEQEALAKFEFVAGDYPEALAWAREELSLPTSPQLTDDEITNASSLLTSVLEGRA
ncbi:MAG: hypothetical protein DCC49_13285 [Acidobacteria bacterium]|nr:MAG: hypothetical protein DCC49_13285 [Acidobacteriota bacterium]